MLEIMRACIDIYNTTGLKGRNGAANKIKKEIEKLVNDKTSKRKQEG